MNTGRAARPPGVVGLTALLLISAACPADIPRPPVGGELDGGEPQAQASGGKGGAGGAPGAGGRGGRGGATAGAGADGANGGTGGGPTGIISDARVPSELQGPDASRPEVGAETSPDLRPADGPGWVAPAACGTERPDISRIQGADGLAIGLDGTIYFTQKGTSDGWVGRLRPGGAALEPRWLTVPGGSKLWGLAIDGGRQRLYVLSYTGKAILVGDLSQGAPPALTPLVSNLGIPNDVVVGPDGAVYFSEHSDNHVYRATAAGARSVVTGSPLATSDSLAPAALAFGPQGDLFVGMTSSAGRLYRLRLAAGVEQSRAPFGAETFWGNGLAFDTAGRLYVGVFSDGDSRIVRLSADGSTSTTVLTGSDFASVAFGRGALDCRDLYAASPSGPAQRVQTDTPGLPVP